MKLTIYTDGGCRPSNPGPGAWAYIAVRDGKRWTADSEYIEHTTNNQAELLACIMALYRFSEQPHSLEWLEIVSDSQYLVRGCTEWSPGWIRRDWTTSEGKPVQNKELWQELLEVRDLYSRCNIDFKHVRGHQGDEWNEACDQLCTATILEHTLVLSA